MNQESSVEVYQQVGVAMTCRSFQEYMDMFQLTEELLAKGRILDVAAGASSFTAKANLKGFLAQAVDPLYALESQAIYEHGMKETNEATRKLSSLTHVYDWTYYGSSESHHQNREQSLELFAKNYQTNQEGIESSRYIEGKLPQLPFEDNQFSLVLCSHFLFLYEEQFDAAFHLQAIRELVRVCQPYGRILLYPLATFKRVLYPHLDDLITQLTSDGVQVELLATPFRFLKGATHFMQITK